MNALAWWGVWVGLVIGARWALDAMDARQPLRHRRENCGGTWALNYGNTRAGIGATSVECVTCGAVCPSSAENIDQAARENAAGYVLQDLADEGVELFGEPWTAFAEPWREDSDDA